jgi:hypothetical protein
MSLCRWSNSCWYIYEPVGSSYVLEVCGFGYFGTPQILRDFSSINKKAKKEGYTYLERMELRGYLQLWALWKMKKLSRKTYVRLLNCLRTYSEAKQYILDPYNVFNFGQHKGIPRVLQVKVSFNKALEEE